VETSLLFWAMGGMMAGNILVAIVSTWIRAVVEVWRSHERGHAGRMVVLTSLFNAGPWAIVAAVIFAYYEYSEPWFVWFVGGAAVWILLLSILVLVNRCIRGKGQGNAA